MIVAVWLSYVSHPVDFITKSSPKWHMAKVSTTGGSNLNASNIDSVTCAACTSRSTSLQLQLLPTTTSYIPSASSILPSLHVFLVDSVSPRALKGNSDWNLQHDHIQSGSFSSDRYAASQARHVFIRSLTNNVALADQSYRQFVLRPKYTRALVFAPKGGLSTGTKEAGICLIKKRENLQPPTVPAASLTHSFQPNAANLSNQISETKSYRSPRLISLIFTLYMYSKGSHLESLRVLDISYNDNPNLFNLGKFKSNALEELRASGNHLMGNGIDFKDIFPKLRVLDLSYNDITQLPENFVFDSLTTLNLSHNRIQLFPLIILKMNALK
ncbi:leucine-rich repeat-containing protein, partial [Planoprotostelium fungivorum]